MDKRLISEKWRVASEKLESSKGKALKADAYNNEVVSIG
jgi:hypothetical protein